MEINNLILLSENKSTEKKENISEGTGLMKMSNKILIKHQSKASNTNHVLNQMYLLCTTLSKMPQSENDIINLMLFYTTPLKENQLLSCNILERDGNYFMYSNLTEVFMLSALKIKNKLRHNYIISCDHNQESSPYFLGRLNSNISNREFILYDYGNKPNDSSSSIKRRYLLEIQFNKKSPFKQATVFLPSNNNQKYYNSDKNKKDKLSLLAKADSNIHQIDTLNPEWSSLYNSFIQNHSTRTIEASKNNFQIGLTSKERQIVMECGKVNNRVYVLDFTMPYSPLQAFAIALSFIL